MIRVYLIVLISGAVLLIFSMIIFVPLWIHPMRKWLMRLVASELLKKGLKKT